MIHWHSVARRAEIETREGGYKRESRLFVEKVFSGSIDRQAGRQAFLARKCFFAGSFLGRILLGCDVFFSEDCMEAV